MIEGYGPCHEAYQKVRLVPRLKPRLPADPVLPDLAGVTIPISLPQPSSIRKIYSSSG